MFNPMQIMQLMGQLQQSSNPMALMQSMFGNNPIMQRAMQMGQGKSPQELQQVVKNLAQQRGMNNDQLNQFLGNFGLKI